MTGISWQLIVKAVLKHITKNVFWMVEFWMFLYWKKKHVKQLFNKQDT